MLAGMETELGPGARRRYLGKTLRGFRGTTATAVVAKKIGISQSALSRIENGRNAILTRHVARLLEVYGVDESRVDGLLRIAEQANERGWWESYSATIPEWFEVYSSLEADAAEVWTYESEFVPGLMQTDDYVRAVRFAAHPESTVERTENLIELRAERQRQLTGQLVAIVSEAVVRRVVGGPEVMRAQLERLVTEAERGRLQVVPFSVGAHPGMNGAFSMLRFDDTDEMDLVYIDTERGGMYLERESDLICYRTIFTRLREQALSGEETAELLATLVAE